MSDRGAARSTILVIIGITGDLSQRKLLPAIEKIAQAGAMPAKFRIIGITRRAVSGDEVLAGADLPFVKKHLDMYRMDLAAAGDYAKLRTYLTKLSTKLGGAQRLFYLSVPPQVSQPVVQLIGQAGLADGDTKLLLEKPFGVDLASAEELIEQSKAHFQESQIYRIDHYLAKEMAQNLIVFRQDNSLFRKTWNKDFIESITIIASEQLGIEGRTAFYEQTGALRDIVQSHLLQLTALTLMEMPVGDELAAIPARRLQALQSLRVPQYHPVTSYVRRGQYEGYREEVDVPHSNTETFISMTLQSNDPRWTGVPINLLSGKALKDKFTEIRLVYKREALHEANELRIRLQPHEGIELYLWAKVPGYQWKVEQHSLHMAFREQFGSLPEAYEQVIVDAIDANRTLFTSSEEVLASWRILEPIRKAWDMTTEDLIVYRPGTDVLQVTP